MLPTWFGDRCSIGSVSIPITSRVTVSADGNSYQGPGIFKTIAGMDPLDPHAAVLSSENITIDAKRVQVDTSQLP